MNDHVRIIIDMIEDIGYKIIRKGDFYPLYPEQNHLDRNSESNVDHYPFTWDIHCSIYQRASQLCSFFSHCSMVQKSQSNQYLD